jgi:hypothetical protein
MWPSVSGLFARSFGYIHIVAHIKYNIPVWGQISCWLGLLQFVYTVPHGWTFGLIHLLASVTGAAMNVRVYASEYLFSVLGIYT